MRRGDDLAPLCVVECRVAANALRPTYAQGAGRSPTLEVGIRARVSDMRKCLVLWGPDTASASRLARGVVARTGRPLADGSTSLNTESSGLLSQLDACAGGILILGPDALLDRTLRLRVLDAAVVVAARPRCRASSPLEELKRPAYDEAHLALDIDEADVGPGIERIVELWERSPVAVGAANRSYCVDVSPAWPEAVVRRCLQGASSILFITDDNVRPLHGDKALELLGSIGKPVVTVVMPAGEQNKNLVTAGRIWGEALAGGIDRRSVVVALGGGVVTDVSGFVAASWMRGLSWIAIPTTLLGMVDASVGGKTAVDLEQAKNAVGAFWQPSAVFCGTEVLKTEPARGYRSALGEVVKTALIGDPELFSLLEERGEDIRSRNEVVLSEIVARCVRVKARVVSLDALEGGLRATLNLGHTIGHALESEGGYSTLTHGEAVSLGLVAALHVGVALGATPTELLERTVRLLRALELPVGLDRAALRRSVELLGYDKKRVGRDLSFVVAQDVGRVHIHRMSLEELVRRSQELADSLGG